MTELTQRFLGDALRTGLTAEEAGQRFCTLVSPELHALLINELGWTPERHQQWVGDLLDNDLLGPDTTAPPAPRVAMPIPGTGD